MTDSESPTPVGDKATGQGSWPEKAPRYAALGGAILVAVVALILVLLLRDDGGQKVSTARPAAQPTAESTTTTEPAANPGAEPIGAVSPTATPEPSSTPTAIPESPPEPTASPTAPPVAASQPTATVIPTAVPTSSTSPTPTAKPEPYPVVGLDITITHPELEVVAYKIECAADEVTAICKTLMADSVRVRLVSGAPSARVCTEIYGGPDLAHIVGTYDGITVDTTVDRANGCGIDDWDRVLAGVLRPARGIAPPPTPASTGAVSGRVTAGPTCPVERADDPCPPTPVVGIVQFLQADRVVASAETNADGEYAADLPPGDYTVIIDVGSRPFPFCESLAVKIVAANETVADVSCDTGIR